MRILDVKDYPGKIAKGNKCYYNATHYCKDIRAGIFLAADKLDDKTIKFQIPFVNHIWGIDEDTIFDDIKGLEAKVKKLGTSKFKLGQVIVINGKSFRRNGVKDMINYLASQCLQTKSTGVYLEGIYPDHKKDKWIHIKTHRMLSLAKDGNMKEIKRLLRAK